jgi:hypothetical protein
MTVRKEATRMCSALIFCCPTNGHKQQLLREQEELANRLREKELSLDNASGM